MTSIIRKIYEKLGGQDYNLSEEELKFDYEASDNSSLADEDEVKK